MILSPFFVYSDVMTNKSQDTILCGFFCFGVVFFLLMSSKIIVCNDLEKYNEHTKLQMQNKTLYRYLEYNYILR